MLDQNNFTPRAQQVMALARKEADRFNHSVVGTEHLLLGILKLGQGTGFNVLLGMNLDLERVRAEVERRFPQGQVLGVDVNIPYSPQVKKVLALAAKEAHALNHTYVGTEHILLGLLLEKGGTAACLLEDFKVDTEVVRQKILEAFDPNFEKSAEISEGVLPSKAVSGLDGEGEQRVLKASSALQSFCEAKMWNSVTIQVFGLEIRVTPRIAAGLIAFATGPSVELRQQEQLLIWLLQQASKE